MKSVDQKDRDKKSRPSARVAISWLLSHGEKFNSIVDFGCGVGSWIAAARELGCKGPFLGMDGPWVPKEYRVIGPKEFVERDFMAKGFPKMDRFDLAICVEVAEHLREQYAEALVDAVTAASDLILWSAAIPKQGGDGHLNERWATWWSPKFSARGYGAEEAIRWHLWRHPDVKCWYQQNVMLYRKGAKIVEPLDAVHPEIWRRKGPK